MPLYKWSQTAASNATADPTINYQEGQTPGSLNDSGRAGMAETRKYVDDIAGAIVTGGTSTAYTVASYSAFDTLAHMNGQMIAFTPNATNGATVTLNVDSLGAKPLRTSTGVELLAGMLIAGTPYVATYNNSDAVWYLHGFFGNPYNIPLAGCLSYFGSTAPNSGFVIPIGQAISRATYSALFSIVSTTYGIGDGSTTFNVPDLTGRVLAGKEASATRLTSTYFAGDSTALGAVGGGESKTLVTGNLPAYTPAGSVSVTSTSSTIVTNTNGFASVVNTGGSQLAFASTVGVAAGAQTSTGTLTGSAQGGTSTPFRTVQPTIICNYIMRVI